ncbi:MAM and LDL-receptor class A domain-containing 1-like [Brachionus plicatilis]|uniref:MAM and LDL-receptor class A domain-containing 1-like n=1 Tax=Brachionus plicatilis TaxID=10195 RepID=A0A3M7P9I0_BRAPC|nr:MAM and LDL-receptor class A domain-containing 1-like [Brachionus plicatilis]
MDFSNFPNFFLMLLILFGSRSMFKFTCDFEKDLCNFQKNEFFVRYSGESPSVSSGPLSDRHKIDGSYILCNGKSLKKDSDQCIMEHSLENISEIHILEFWYHQYGSQIGTLSLVINSSINVWSSVGRQRIAWTFAKVYLPTYTNKVEFRANRSIHGRFSSDIGLDDISISSVNDINEEGNKKLSKLRGENFDKLGQLNGWHTNFKNYNWIQTDGSNINNMGPLSDFDSICNLFSCDAKLPHYLQIWISAIFFDSTHTLYKAVKIQTALAKKKIWAPLKFWLNLGFHIPNYFVRSYDGISSTKNICTIPYTFTSSHGLKEFYCKRIHELNESVCGLTLYPNISFDNSTGKCYRATVRLKIELESVQADTKPTKIFRNISRAAF